MNRVFLTALVTLFCFGCSDDRHEQQEASIDDPQSSILAERFMLTPAYYENNESVILAIDQQLAALENENIITPTQSITSFTVPEQGAFGSLKGNGNATQYHPAVDLHFENRTTEIELVAMHDGIAYTFRDAEKYRHYLAIEMPIENEYFEEIGKLVTIYAHIDLDLDEDSGLFLDGKEVKQGDIVSRHLYSDTVGGPHLHLEMRLYRTSDTGQENFYGGFSDLLNQPSSGPWSHGYWSQTIGYGFINSGYLLGISSK